MSEALLYSMVTSNQGDSSKVESLGILLFVSYIKLLLVKVKTKAKCT